MRAGLTTLDSVMHSVQICLARQVSVSSDDNIQHPYTECLSILEDNKTNNVAQLPIFKTFMSVLNSYY